MYSQPLSVAMTGLAEFVSYIPLRLIYSRLIEIMVEIAVDEKELCFFNFTVVKR